MIVGFLWDKMTPQVQSQVVRDLMELGSDVDGAYWTGVEIDPMIRVLGIPRITDRARVEVWRTYQTQEQKFRPDVGGVKNFPCVLYQKPARSTLVKPKIVTQRQRENKQPEQGMPNTYNPYDRPMPDPNGAVSNSYVLQVLIGTQTKQ